MTDLETIELAIRAAAAKMKGDGCRPFGKFGPEVPIPIVAAFELLADEIARLNTAARVG